MKQMIIIHMMPADVGTFTAPFEDDYALLLVISSPSITQKQRVRMALEIVSSRCQYALTYGHDCEDWHDAIDTACFDDGVPEGRFLMTTWHNDESINDVVDFLFWNTSYEDFEASRVAIVQIGSDAGLDAALRARVAYHQARQAE